MGGKEGKEARTKDVVVERSEVTPTVDGLRRSRRVRNLPPPPPPQLRSEVGGSSSRKRPAGPPEQENGAKTKKITDEGVVSVSAKVKVANRAGKEETDKMLLVVRKQSPEPKPILPKYGQTDDESTVEVERVAANKGREPSASSLSSRGNGNAAVGAGRSEILSSQDGVAHPCLFIDTILDVVFKHIIGQPETKQDRKVVGKDVQNIRQVCKIWKTSLTRLYRQTVAHAEFYFYEYPEWTREKSREPTLTEFLDTMRHSEMIPVQKFKFLNGSVIGPNGDPELFREFLVRCGPEAKTLDLAIRSCESEKVMLNLRDLPDLHLATLTRLYLHIYENHQVTFQANRLPGYVKLIELLLSAAKSLWKFGLYYPLLQPISNRDQEAILIQQLVPTIAKTLPISVKEFELDVEMNESGFDGLAGIQSQLKIFVLDVPSSMGSKTMYRFLQSQATSLQHFQLLGHIKGDFSFADFPRLHELTQLEMCCDYVDITAPFECAEIFPKLQCFKIKREVGEPFLTILSRAQKPLQSLKVLHLTSRLCIEPGFFKGIAKSFPCLAELRFGVDSVSKEVMGEVFAYFENLELLDITDFYSPNCVESLFSGIAESECSRIEEAKDFEKEDQNELQRQPSLLNLTKLRQLVVDIGLSSCHGHWFTDFSAHFVFLEMDNLRELHLSKWNVEFSPKYRELLETKLDKLVLL